MFIVLQIFFATRGFGNRGIFNNYSMSARWICAELAIIISYPKSARGIIVLLKTPPKYRKLDYNKNKKVQKVTHALAIFALSNDPVFKNLGYSPTLVWSIKRASENI